MLRSHLGEILGSIALFKFSECQASLKPPQNLLITPPFPYLYSTYIWFWYSRHFTDKCSVAALHKLEVFQSLFNARDSRGFHGDGVIESLSVVVTDWTRVNPSFPVLNLLHQTRLKVRYFESLQCQLYQVQERKHLTNSNLNNKGAGRSNKVRCDRLRWKLRFSAF